MDNVRAFEDETDFAAPGEEEPVSEAPPPEIGIDERRMHVRAYNYWVSLLDGRPFPLIAFATANASFLINSSSRNVKA